MVKAVVSTTAAIAGAVTEIVSLLSRWLGSADHRRMAKAIRLGDKIVKQIEELEINDRELNRLLKKWDKYNN